jgi:hypothetical protein
VSVELVGGATERTTVSAAPSGSGRSRPWLSRRRSAPERCRLSGLGAVRLPWEVDHSGPFHLVQMLGLALMVTGLRRLLPLAALEVS